MKNATRRGPRQRGTTGSGPRLNPRQCDMSSHHRMHPGRKAGFVNATECHLPFLLGKSINRDAEVLVAKIDAISGEVLGGRAKPMVLEAPNQRGRQLGDAIRETSQRAHANDRIQPVQREVHYGSERPVESEPRGFDGGPFAILVGYHRVVHRTQRQIDGERGQATNRSAGPVLQIARNGERDLTFPLKTLNEDLQFIRAIPIGPDDFASKKNASDRTFVEIGRKLFVCEPGDFLAMDLAGLPDLFASGEMGGIGWNRHK